MKEITKPTIILDKPKCITNIKLMVNKAITHGIQLRPHFKTHQSQLVAEWFKDFGIDRCTVSSVAMAKYFVGTGWKDITIAMPVNIREIEDINILAEKINLNLLVESIDAVNFLSSELKSRIGLFIKIDCGYGRAGISSVNISEISKLIQAIQQSTNICLKGFLTHAGHTYKAKSFQEILNIHDKTIRLMKELKAVFASEINNCIISVGDTPGCSLSNNFDGIDEIRPGNFVFYDVMQAELGSCNYNNIAVAVACPVVAKHEDRNEIIIYGGAVHLSKDYVIDQNGNNIYGKIVDLNNYSWNLPEEDCFVKSVSQEHGIVKVSAVYFKKVNIGDLIGVLPIHSCLTIDLLRQFYIKGAGFENCMK